LPTPPYQSIAAQILRFAFRKCSCTVFGEIPIRIAIVLFSWPKHFSSTHSLILGGMASITHADVIVQSVISQLFLPQISHSADCVVVVSVHVVNMAI
jgi:hypothetical protein